MHTSPVRQRVSRRGFIAQLLTHAGRRPTSLRLVEFVFHLNRSSPPRPDEASLRLPSRGTQGRGFQSSAPRTTALTWLEPGTGTDSCSQPRTPRTGQLSWNSREGVEPSGPALTHACFFLEGCNPCPSKMPHHTDSDTTRASSCPRGHQRSRPVRAEEAGSAHQTHGGLISPGQWPLSAISGEALRFVFKKKTWHMFCRPAVLLEIYRPLTAELSASGSIPNETPQFKTRGPCLPESGHHPHGVCVNSVLLLACRWHREPGGTRGQPHVC